jgi:signal transduction histidine kinase
MGSGDSQTPAVSSLKTGETNRHLSRVSGGFPGWARGLVEGFIPARCQDSAEQMRQARLIVRFALLGVVSGALYAGFFLLVEHYFGTAIILICSLGFAGVPFLVKRTGSLALCGNLLSGIMVTGFTGLCAVEGGMHGHALAWLASIPLCALLLVGKEAAKIWVIVSFMASAGMIAMGLLGIALPKTYPSEWDGLITAIGYLGLIPFMFLLGMSFETSREVAFGKMQTALRELEASNAELVRLNQEKSEFMGIAAHDLKNPLTVIIGNAELIGRARNPGMVAQLVDNIRLSGTRMYDLIKNLLDANAIEEGKFQLQMERCDLCELLERSLEGNYFAATRKGIQIQIIKPGQAWVLADEAATSQVLDNLVSNAVKYSMPNSLVEVRVELAGNQVSLAVKDEGPGLSEEDQKKLFQKFTRLTAKPTDGESSNGLGLSIVKKLVESMSGQVVCRSVLGQGATFLVSLPAWREEVRAKVEMEAVE